ncbi:MAG: DDE-type integrase/transposase/recombinase [Acidobacteriota bacterium]|nr:DDE-type integrase/transposase/recombinase [Acidobacteriota bacterium]
MTEEQKKEVAVFRYGIIADFAGATRLDPGEQEKLLQDKCARKWQIPYSGRTRLSRSTILRWVRAYNEGNGKLEALYPQERADLGGDRALDEETGMTLIELRRQLPTASVPVLIRMLHEQQLIPAGTPLSQTTVYRFLHRNNLMSRKTPDCSDRRKFEAESPNDLWQSDVMHGPVLFCGGKRHKSYLIAFIDDHSRLIPHARFYPSEGLASFMDCFSQALRKRGLPRKLYVDNGSAFRSRQLEFTTASLAIALIHAKPYQPQGKGKIERFFKTVRTQFLPFFKGETLDAINLAFTLWLEDQYHQRTHSSTGQSPFTRFTSKMECLRNAPDNLNDYFRKTVRRRVNKDRSLVVDKRLFEAPVALIGRRVEVLYHEHTPEQLEVRYNGESYGLLYQLDVHVNSRVRRDKNNQIELAEPIAPGKGGQLWES